MFFPHHTIARRILVNATLIWLGLRFVAAMLGCGKTTLVRIACGLLKPDYGVVVYRGERLTRPKLWKLASC